MFKLSITHKNCYNEIGQSNPLRWRIMFKEKDTLHSQSGLLKCKDFFNDVVAWKVKKAKFCIYKFNNTIKFNRFGVYLLLTNVYDADRFIESVECALNSKLYNDLQVSLKVYKQGKDKVVVLIPNKLWKNTYHISLVTMMLRVCNYNYCFKYWEDFFKEDSPLLTVERVFNKETIDFTLANGFILPKKWKSCWYNAGWGWNGRAKKELNALTIHNNGVVNWVKALGV